ncbi:MULTISPECIES: type IV secretion system protein [unclassified Gilliamella]|uniref:type IV secretion system protein n=1 Tax=unclassified Gilliamella TaxID=2685620 RepID=UPI00226A9724|nr:MULTISPECIES: type IV secretion system protein [unclassified Gilliamella]MCX8587970.1 type IV secretion system protein [Gilliamella sp. B3801]MCX8592409.1 type IV secretion system protein [Gilliamella sp. B3804]
MAGVFTTLQKFVDKSLAAVTAPKITELVSAISEIFGSIMLLWVTYKSIEIALGSRPFRLGEHIHKILIISIVTSIAFDADGWIKTVLDIIKEVKGVLVEKGGAIAQLDSQTDKFNNAIEPIIKKAFMFERPFIAVSFWACFFIMAGSCLFALLTSEIILAFALLFTPLAILSLSFENTKKVFEGWLSAVVGAIITMVLSGLMMSLMSGFLKTLCDSIGKYPQSYRVICAACLFFAIFFYYVMSEVKKLAQAFTGFTCGSILNAWDGAVNTVKTTANVASKVAAL